MSPNEVFKEEHKSKVKEYQGRYKKEFKRKQLVQGQKVLVKNEFKRTKMDEDFNDYAIVADKVRENSYQVKTHQGKVLMRHVSQLRRL